MLRSRYIMGSIYVVNQSPLIWADRADETVLTRLQIQNIRKSPFKHEDLSLDEPKAVVHKNQPVKHTNSHGSCLYQKRALKGKFISLFLSFFCGI